MSKHVNLPIFLALAALASNAPTLARADLGFAADPATIEAFGASPDPFAAALAEPPATSTVEWRVMKDHWSAEDEANFSAWVNAMGKQKCRTTDECFKSDANPYKSTDPVGAKYFSDCADLPYLMRGYFAWKNNLPFGYINDVDPFPQPTPTPAPGETPRPFDIRYTVNGNYPAARFKAINPLVGARVNGWKTLRSIMDQVSTAVFRIGPIDETKYMATDLYPTAVTRESIRPGSTLYDPAGHVAMVYAVEPDGRILYMDAHPDNSLTRGTFSKKFLRGNPGMGPGFKNFRPITLVGATVSADGDLRGGKYVYAKNAELADYSKVQYYGTRPDAGGNWRRGVFEVRGKVVDYWEFFRRSLATGEFHYDPIREVGLLLKSLCTDLNDRAISVQTAVTAGIPAKDHPLRLPTNIYGTEGEWEEFATPSRDMRLKNSVREIHDREVEFLRMWSDGDPSLDYSGSDLKGDLRRVIATESAACSVKYSDSNGRTRTLSLIDASKRLFAMSFDPYDCVEHRWGANTREELDGCPSSMNKVLWYRALRKLRNAMESYQGKMDFSLEEMTDPKLGGALGAETTPEVDFEAPLR